MSTTYALGDTFDTGALSFSVDTVGTDTFEELMQSELWSPRCKGCDPDSDMVCYNTRDGDEGCCGYCRDDGDCNAYERCRELTGMDHPACLPDNACRANDDCNSDCLPVCDPVSETCVAGITEFTPECIDHDDCGLYQICNLGTCKVACVQHKECPLD